MNFSRRSVLRASAASFAMPALSAIGLGSLSRAEAQTKTWQHGLSLFGDIKYPEGFKHFDYVNPRAPQGGTVRLSAFGTFDNFNTVVAGVKGSIAAGSELFIETLMTPALDEVSTAYGLLAETVSHPADHSAVTYRLRANARWHDGKPVTPDDVIFSFEVLKTNSPFYGAYYRHVTKVELTGEREITFTFDGPGNRELPHIVGQLPVLPKHWWQGTDKNGNKRDISQTTLEPPLGSGPYKLTEFAPGRTLVYEKVDDYWGKDVNVIIGTRNFQQIRYEYFRDLTVALEGFKGDQLDWRFENSAKDWALSYDFPAVREKRVVREEFPVRDRGIMQAFVFNTRRDKFKDPHVRRAFNFAFDFEEMNRQLFFGQYSRIASYFEGTELAATGLPEGKELEILEGIRDKVPSDLFTKAYTNPVSGTPQAVRDNLRQALEWSLSGSVEKGLCMASALLWFWHTRNHRAEGVEWLNQLLDAEAANALAHIDNRRFRPLLIPLLYDRDVRVVQKAIGSARAMGASDGLFVPGLLSLLGHRALKSDAREALVGYGEPIIDALAHALLDHADNLAAVRRSAAERPRNRSQARPRRAGSRARSGGRGAARRAPAS